MGQVAMVAFEFILRFQQPVRSTCCFHLFASGALICFHLRFDFRSVCFSLSCSYRWRWLLEMLLSFTIYNFVYCNRPSMHKCIIILTGGKNNNNNNNLQTLIQRHNIRYRKRVLALKLLVVWKKCLAEG